MIQKAGTKVISVADKQISSLNWVFGGSLMSISHSYCNEIKTKDITAASYITVTVNPLWCWDTHIAGMCLSN